MTYLHIDPEEETIGVRRETLVRLAGAQAREVKRVGPRRDREQPMRPPAPQAPASHAGRKLYRSKPGFTNYYFNELEQKRVLRALDTFGQFDKLAGLWSLEGDVERPLQHPFAFTIDDKQVTIRLDQKSSVIEPLKAGETPENLAAPAGSGGLAMALFHWRRFLTERQRGFDAAFFYAGTEPYYPTGQPRDMILTDVLQTEYAATVCKWYFEISNGKLIGAECWLLPDTDPCELSFFDYQLAGEVQFPTALLVRYADREFGYYRLKKTTLTPGTPAPNQPPDAEKKDTTENKEDPANKLAPGRL
ncbi:MAG TPA: hypothetical protein PKA06_06545 [Gemmatales bacterium]|nr:hypothetical protein [Gemmatales bacterium]